MILILRTDRPDSEIYLYENGKEIYKKIWHAHRKLAETLHKEIEIGFKEANKAQEEIAGIVIYEGPGSFTGLRIGMSAANALAYSLNIPITASSGDDWIGAGLEQLKTLNNFSSVVPEYGSGPHITTPKK
jgi:tRNA threonylcarbamoyladenosine biosynthesis protein TsaB